MRGIKFIDPIEGTDTCEWRCLRCGDYIISRVRPKCAKCDEDEMWAVRPPGMDIVPLQSHERRPEG